MTSVHAAVWTFSRLGAELAEFAEWARIADKPVLFYSISKGAHITMRMAGEQNPDVTAYVLIVPMVQVNTGDSDYSTVQMIVGAFHALGLGRLYAPGYSKWPNGELAFGKPTPCNANPDTAQTEDALFAERETLRTNGVTMRETAGGSDRGQSSTRLLQMPRPALAD